MKLTEWFGPEVKPDMNGVYELDDSNTDIADGCPCYSKWNGVEWLGAWRTIETAHKFGSWPARHQDLPWRGLAEKPE